MKVFYFDCETTGTNAATCGITQLAYIVEIGDREIESGCIYIDPRPCELQPKAFEITGMTEEQLDSHESAQSAYNKLITLFDKYVDRYDKSDKFFASGYNVGFDLSFLRAFFERFGNNYLGSYFFYPTLDPSALVAWAIKSDIIDAGSSHKLADIARSVGIPLENAHDAIDDIRATRDVANELYYLIRAE